MGIGHNTKVFSTVKIIELYTSNYWLPERGQKKGGGQRKRRRSIKISDSTTGCTLDGIKTEEQIETFTVVAKP